VTTPRETETEALARRLSELRDASGRSYGALARRLGVSASTLHRYCSGRTVPQEFAPVERLARLCGATGDELLALHRLWLLADADRTRRQEAAGGLRAPAAPSAPVAGPGTEAATAKTADPQTADPENAPPDGAPVVPAAPAAGPGPADPGSPATPGPGRPERTAPPAGGDPGAPSGTGATGPALPDTGTGAGDGAVDVPAPGAPEVTVVLGDRGRGARRPGGPAARGGGRARRHARPLAYATGAVAAAVAIVLIMAFDWFPKGSPGGGTGEEPEAAGTRRTADRVPGTAPSAGRPSASGSPSARATAGGPASRPATPGTPSAPAGTQGGGGAPAGTPGPSTGAGGGVPFTVGVERHVWLFGCDHTYFVGRAPAAVPPPPAEGDAAGWVRSMRAVDGGRTMVRVTVQGKEQRATVLQSLRVRVAARRAPAPGNLYRMDSGCGGSLTPRQFAVDLDKPRPVARPEDGADENGPLPAVSFPYRVSAEDPEILLVSADSVNCDCDWYLELDWRSGDRTGTVRIDDNGRPFRTSGTRGRTAHLYDPGTGAWVVEPPLQG
jgi:transcriptional regulator with XRE-family HTH domain